MTQDFFARYRLLRCIAVEGGVRTHNALEEGTQRVVMVHIMDDASDDDVADLRATLDRLPYGERGRVLSTERIPAGFAVVTEFLAGFTSLNGWLAARATAPAPAPAREAAPPRDEGPSADTLIREDANLRTPEAFGFSVGGADAAAATPAAGGDGEAAGGAAGGGCSRASSWGAGG